MDFHHIANDNATLIFKVINSLVLREWGSVRDILLCGILEKEQHAFTHDITSRFQKQDFWLHIFSTLKTE